jgi:hypothetical protein
MRRLRLDLGNVGGLTAILLFVFFFTLVAVLSDGVWGMIRTAAVLDCHTTVAYH